jgi:DNA (cytosine-5)-methyltransferase 1
LSRQQDATTSLRVVGLFAGIGGIELGLHRAGHVAELLCEIEPAAQEVLRTHFADVELVSDVRHLRSLPAVDVVAAGFPCQDLSQAGRTAGISGVQSGLVREVFRLLNSSKATWLLLENVPFMLQLDRGRAMRLLVDELEALGYRWAYRIIDTQSFGLPQRRRRVLLLASRTEDPRAVLLTGDAGAPKIRHRFGAACGFYWTEGLRGLGWAVDALPTLKGGSSIGIASPPAIWNPVEETIVTPELRDAERLQGFPADWTLPAVTGAGVRVGARWKLVGNAVSVPVAEWLGNQLVAGQQYDGAKSDRPLDAGQRWPSAAWGQGGNAFEADASEHPVRARRRHLLEFLRFPTSPLSARATEGFLRRATSGGLRFVDGFLTDVATHLERMTVQGAA